MMTVVGYPGEGGGVKAHEVGCNNLPVIWRKSSELLPSCHCLQKPEKETQRTASAWFVAPRGLFRDHLYSDTALEPCASPRNSAADSQTARPVLCGPGPGSRYRTLLRFSSAGERAERNPPHVEHSACICPSMPSFVMSSHVTHPLPLNLNTVQGEIT